MIQKIPKFLLMVFCFVLLSGCWDDKELNSVAVVMGVGFDKAKGNEYKVTAQVIKPTSKGGGTDTSGGGSEIPTWSLSATGKTTLEAIQNLNRISPRRLYWAHMQVIILGEELAKDGVSQIITWFQRDIYARSGTVLVMSKGNAEDLLNHKIELENVPSRAISDLLLSTDMRQLSAKKTVMREFMSELVTPGIDSAVDVIMPKKIRGKIESYYLDGIGMFKKDKFVGYLPTENSLVPEFIFNKFRNGVFTVKCPGSNKQSLSFIVTDFQSHVKPKLKGDQITFMGDIFVEGNLADQTCTEDLLQPAMKKRVEKEIARHIKKMIKETFAESSAKKVDLFGIGRDVRRYYPEYWGKNGQHWDDILPTVKLQLKVQAHIRRFGLTIDPIISKLK